MLTSSPGTGGVSRLWTSTLLALTHLPIGVPGPRKAGLRGSWQCVRWLDSCKWKNLYNPSWPGTFLCQLFKLLVYTAPTPQGAARHHSSKCSADGLLAVIQFVLTSLFALSGPRKPRLFLAPFTRVHAPTLEPSILCAPPVTPRLLSCHFPPEASV